MMRPTIEQLVEYVRDGEDDPKVADMLRHDPDAEPKLREARFICGMIGEQSVPDSDDGSRPAVVGEALAMADMALSAREAPSEWSAKRPSLRLAEPPDGRYQVPEIIDNVTSGAPPGEDLGTVVAVEGEKLYILSHRTPKGKKQDDSAKDKEITIDWGPFKIHLARSIEFDRPLEARITAGEDDSPVDGVDVVFMAKSGPFDRDRTDHRGVASLAPLQDGVLRISAKHIGLLRIERKKEA